MDRRVRRRIFLLLLLLSLIYSVNAIGGFNFVIGNKSYPKPNMPKPNKGNFVVDPNFHTEITRITDASKYKVDGIMPEYCRADIVNSDGTLIMLSYKERNWYIYDAKNFRLVKRLDPRKLGWQKDYNGGPIEPRWAPSNPKIFYYVLPGANGDLSECTDPATFNMYNLATDKRTVLYDAKKDYPGATRLATQTEGEPSKDGRIWAWFITYPGNRSGKTTIIIYDKDYYGKNRGEVIKRWGNNALTGDYITVSPSGKYVVIPHYVKGRWIVSYPVANFPNAYINLPGAGGHSDFAMKADGTEVYFYQNEQTDYISMAGLATGAVTNIVKISCGGSPWHCPGVHFSGNNYDKPGWGLVSTYHPNGLWMDEQLFMVELKTNGRVWRLAHSHSVGSDYWAQPHATINRRGTKVFWGSNWDNPSGTVDTYQLSLPEKWNEELAGYNTSK